jgi:hypothetical protein
MTIIDDSTERVGLLWRIAEELFQAFLYIWLNLFLEKIGLLKFCL